VRRLRRLLLRCPLLACANRGKLQSFPTRPARMSAIRRARRHIDEGRTMMHMAIGMLAALGPLQVFIGDEHGRDALEPTASHATSGSDRGRRLAKVHRATEWLKPSFARSSASASVRDQMPKLSSAASLDRRLQRGSPAQGSRLSFTP
jgi:hypothetical protein